MMAPTANVLGYYGFEISQFLLNNCY